MGKIIVHGGNKLSGEIQVQGAKNAVLPILASCVLVDGEITLHNVPRITDTFLSIDILKNLGASVNFNGNTLIIDSSRIKSLPVPEEQVSKMRSSIIFMGSLLSRFKEVRINYPGGCKLGARAIDMHIKGIQNLGGVFEDNSEQLICKAKNLVGTRIDLDFPSVGATQNIILASVYAHGMTTITNAAAEPEIVDMVNFLNKCGADIRGAGTDVVTIMGGRKLVGASYNIMPDRIVAGTYIAAAAVTKGNIRLRGINEEDMRPITQVFRQMGMDIKVIDNDMYIRSPKKLRPVTVKTMPHPGFPTDMQPQLMTALSLADGVSILEETIFEARDMHVAELNRMGAKILTQPDRQKFIITGVDELVPSSVVGKDLRGGAALVLAGLSAKGSTPVFGTEHIERGYEDIVHDLSVVCGVLNRDDYLEEEIA